MGKKKRENMIKGMYNSLDIIPPPGIPGIKQCEMYTNLRSIVPKEYKYYYPKPLQDVIDENKNCQKRKRENKLKKEKTKDVKKKAAHK